MAVMNEEILKIIKKKFEDKEFILDEGVIYKLVTTNSVSIDKNQIPINEFSDIVKSFHEKKQNADLVKTYGTNLKKFISERKYIMQDNKLYKIYGSKNKRGYVNFSITIDGIFYYTQAHKIIYYIHHEIWDEIKVINHIDFNKSNNKIENLELIYQFDNILHSIRNDHKMRYFALHMNEETKEHYKLNDKQWEILKVEAYKAYRKFVLENFNPLRPEYKCCADFGTIDEYKSHEQEYEEKYVPLMELEFQRREDKKEEYEKEIKKSIRKIAKSYGMKFYHDYIYISVGGYFFKMYMYSYFYTKDRIDITNLRINVEVKTIESDELLWNITNMKRNLRLPERYRAVGDYTVPTFNFEEKVYEIHDIEEVEKVCRLILSSCKESINSFINRFTNVDLFYNYISKQHKFLGDKIIKMLLLIQMERYDEALKIVTHELQKGKRGYYTNGSKDTYIYLKEYCDKKIIGVD